MVTQRHSAETELKQRRMKNTEVNAINEAETRFQPKTTKHGTNFAPQRGLDFFVYPAYLPLESEPSCIRLSPCLEKGWPCLPCPPSQGSRADYVAPDWPSNFSNPPAPSSSFRGGHLIQNRPADPSGPSAKACEESALSRYKLQG